MGNLKVTVLGTGTFFVSTKRSAQSYLIEAENKKILVDCGPGTLYRLSEIGIKPDDIDYVLLTHFHADHTSDLFPFQMNFRLKEFFGKDKEYKTPVIYGPVGIQEFTKKLSYIYELPAFDNYDKIKWVEHQPEYHLDEIIIKTFEVDHTAFGHKANAYAIRIEHQDKILVFSGDSIYCQGIVEASKNADLLICDTSYHQGKSSPAHMDTTDIAKIGKESNVKKVVLTHFYPTNDDQLLKTEVENSYKGEVILGEDLKVFEV